MQKICQPRGFWFQLASKLASNLHQTCNLSCWQNQLFSVGIDTLNHRAALVDPTTWIRLSLRSSRNKAWICPRLRLGNTCCNSLNGVPNSLLSLICLYSNALFVSRSNPTTRVWTPRFPAAVYKLRARTYLFRPICSTTVSCIYLIVFLNCFLN